MSETRWLDPEEAEAWRAYIEATTRVRQACDTALAAEVAESDVPANIAAEINGVTKDGEKCTDYASCVELVRAGTDIDYDGVGGPYEFGDAGEPEAASFRIATYDGGADPNPELDVYVFAS